MWIRSVSTTYVLIIVVEHLPCFHYLWPWWIHIICSNLCLFTGQVTPSVPWEMEPPGPCRDSSDTSSPSWSAVWRPSMTSKSISTKPPLAKLKLRFSTVNLPTIISDYVHLFSILPSLKIIYTLVSWCNKCTVCCWSSCAHC